MKKSRKAKIIELAEILKDRDDARADYAERFWSMKAPEVVAFLHRHDKDNVRHSSLMHLGWLPAYKHPGKYEDFPYIVGAFTDEELYGKRLDVDEVVPPNLDAIVAEMFADAERRFVDGEGTGTPRGILAPPNEVAF